MIPVDKPYIRTMLRYSFAKGPMHAAAFWWPVWFPIALWLVWLCVHPRTNVCMAFVKAGQ